MAASWEMKRQGSVLVGILHVETTTVAWAFGLRNLIVPGGIIPLSGMPFDHARNTACMSALDHGVDYIFFLDSDVVPPRDAILRLMAHQLPIVSGVYCRRSPPVAVPVMIKNGNWITEYPANALIEVDLVGAGCLLIHRDVLTSLPPIRDGRHWFSWQVDMRGILPPEECLSEDFVFCHHARKHGYKVVVDTSIQCRHLGNAEAKHGSFGPLESTPVT